RRRRPAIAAATPPARARPPPAPWRRGQGRAPPRRYPAPASVSSSSSSWLDSIGRARRRFAPLREIFHRALEIVQRLYQPLVADERPGPRRPLGRAEIAPRPPEEPPELAIEGAEQHLLGVGDAPGERVADGAKIEADARQVVAEELRDRAPLEGAARVGREASERPLAGARARRGDGGGQRLGRGDDRGVERALALRARAHDGVVEQVDQEL